MTAFLHVVVFTQLPLTSCLCCSYSANKEKMQKLPLLPEICGPKVTHMSHLCLQLSLEKQS